MSIYNLDHVYAYKCIYVCVYVHVHAYAATKVFPFLVKLFPLSPLDS